MLSTADGQPVWIISGGVPVLFVLTMGDVISNGNLGRSRVPPTQCTKLRLVHLCIVYMLLSNLQPDRLRNHLPALKPAMHWL